MDISMLHLRLNEFLHFAQRALSGGRTADAMTWLERALWTAQRLPGDVISYRVMRANIAVAITALEGKS